MPIPVIRCSSHAHWPTPYREPNPSASHLQRPGRYTCGCRGVLEISSWISNERGGGRRSGTGGRASQDPISRAQCDFFEAGALRVKRGPDGAQERSGARPESFIIAQRARDSLAQAFQATDRMAVATAQRSR
jgi:hypothetical protein